MSDRSKKTAADDAAERNRQELETARAVQKTTDEAAAEGARSAPKSQAAGAVYRVKSQGLTGAGGATYMANDTVTADQLGDDARIKSLLTRGSIERADQLAGEGDEE